MQAMLLIYSDEAKWAAMDPAEQGAVIGAYGAYVEALRAAGAMRGGERLMPSATAHSLRVQGGAPQVLDGPAAAPPAPLAGFGLLEVPDMQAARHWAARCPGASHGTLEIREVWPAPA